MYVLTVFTAPPPRTVRLPAASVLNLMSDLTAAGASRCCGSVPADDYTTNQGMIRLFILPVSVPRMCACPVNRTHSQRHQNDCCSLVQTFVHCLCNLAQHQRTASPTIQPPLQQPHYHYCPAKFHCCCSTLHGMQLCSGALPQDHQSHPCTSH